MSEATQARVKDLFDYVATLDAAEALGEIQHIGESYNAVHLLGKVLGTRAATKDYAELVLPVVFTLASRIANGLGCIHAVEPCHDQAGGEQLHSCDLIMRMLETRAAGA